MDARTSRRGDDRRGRGMSSPADKQGTMLFANMPMCSLCAPLPLQKELARGGEVTRGFFLKVLYKELPRTMRIALGPKEYYPFRINQIRHHTGHLSSILLCVPDVELLDDREKVIPINLRLLFPDGFVAFWKPQPKVEIFRVSAKGDLTFPPQT